MFKRFKNRHNLETKRIKGIRTLYSITLATYKHDFKNFRRMKKNIDSKNSKAIGCIGDGKEFLYDLVN